MNLNYFFKRKKTTCLFIFLSILIFASNISFAAQDSYKPRSLYDTVMTQGVFSINVQPVSPSNLPPAGAIPIDNLIRQITAQDGFVNYPDLKTEFKQQRLNFLKKNRTTFLKWSKGAIGKLDSYIIANKGSLEALNNLQIFAEIVKCHQNGGTPEQCAQQAGKDALMRMAGGTLITHLGLGSMATFGALAIANYEAVIKTVELYNEVTGLIEDEKMAEEQKIDRMALGADVRSMKSYLELMLVRYEQNQNSVGELLITLWEDAEEQSKRLKTAEGEFTAAWKEIENKNYPGQLQNNCVTGCNLDEKCSALINSYTVLTGNPLPEAGANASFLRHEFQKALNSDFEKKCIARSYDIKKKIETIIQKKVDPLHNGYKSLEFYIAHAIQAREKYLADQKKYLQRNKTLNLHYEQQLSERYGKDSEKYKEKMAVLNRITNQIKTYQPQRLKGNMKYIFKRLDRIQEDFEFINKKLVRVFNDIETHIEVINKVEKSFKSTAQSKSETLATKFVACADERISNQTASLADETTKDNAPAKKLCNETKNTATALLVKLQNHEKKFISFGDNLKKFFKKLKDLKKESQFAKTAHKDMEKKATAVAEISHELEKLTLKICETTKELNDYTKTDSEHDRNYDWINSKKKRLKELLDSAKNIIKEADLLEKESKKRLESVNLLKDTSQAALQKIDKDIKVLLEASFGESMDELNHKAQMITTDDCPEDVFSAIRQVTKHYQKDQDKLKQITAFYKTVKIDFDKKIEDVENLDQIYQKTAYLLDLSKAYVERAENAAVKGAFCVVLAENIMEKVFIPDVRGVEISKADSRVSSKGLTVTRSELGSSPENKETGVVTKISPGITKRVKKSTVVTLSYYDERPDKDSLLANANCGDPNSRPVWDDDQNQVMCECLPGTVWNSDKRACIDSKQAALEGMICSHYPGTVPGYGPNGEPMCVCPGGLPWVKNLNRCATQQDVAAVSVDCSKYPGTISRWDAQNNQATCECPYGTVWDSGLGRCIDEQELAIANTDCSHLPGSVPVWSYITNRPECECQSPYSRDPKTGRCIDFMAQLAQEQREFDERMANQRRRNQQQQQQFFNNMMNTLGGFSQSSLSGNPAPQGDQNQGQRSSSKKPEYCGIWEVKRTCIQEENIENKKEYLGKTYTRKWTLFPYNGGKTIEISESDYNGNTFVRFKKPGSSGSTYSVTHTFQNEPQYKIRKNIIKLSVSKNSFNGTWKLIERYKSSGRKVGSRTYSITGVKKIRSYN